jgi:hypothetical protein
MIRRDPAVECAIPFFRDHVERAMARQRLSANELTAFYIVHLLASFLPRADHAADSEPMAVRLLRALETGGVSQRAGLKSVADESLFVSGFFSDSLRRKLVDVDYYVTLGGSAYQTLSRLESDTFAPVFAELGEKFVAFVDVLSDISEHTSCTSNADLLRLYDRWQKTGSRRCGQLLIERGFTEPPGKGVRPA